MKTEIIFPHDANSESLYIEFYCEIETRPNIWSHSVYLIVYADSVVIRMYMGPLKGGGGLVLCAMCKNHLLAMCYVICCSHCYVKLK